MARVVWSRRLTVFALATALLSIVGIETQAQNSTGTASTPEEQAVFRSGVTLVTTDLIVRNRDGIFLADLTKDDFLVYEDDKLQEVVSLVLVHGGRVYNQLLPPPPAPEGIILPPTRARNETAGRIFVILVDDLHIVTRDTPRARAIFDQLADNLIHEGDMFGIVSTGPSSIAIDMTYDRNQLIVAANKITGEGFSPNELAQLSPGSRGPTELAWRAHTAFKTARGIVSGLDKIQNRRKVVLYFSGGYDFNPFAFNRVFNRSAAGMLGSGVGYTRSIYSGIADPLTDPFLEIERQGEVFADGDLAQEIAELTKAANRANASFYTVDPRGLIAGPDMDYTGGLRYFNDWRMTTQASLRALAELTGGRAIVNRNDYDDAFKEIDAETSDYYVIGFYSSNPDPTFRTRTLRVEVNRDEEMEVQHRTHYTYERVTDGDRLPAP